MNPTLTYSLFSGSLHLAAGLVVGLTALAAGYTIGIVGEAGVRGLTKQPRLFLGFILVLIFAEVLGIYGLLASILMHMKARDGMFCDL